MADYSAIIDAYNARDYVAFQNAVAAQNLKNQYIDAYNATGDNWHKNKPWGTADVNKGDWTPVTKALNSLGWLTGSGGGGGTPVVTPGANTNMNGLLEGGLANLGLGAVASGPNYQISSAFRHLFTQPQIDAFAVKQPASLYRMGSSGDIQQAQFDWWKPDATLSGYSNIPLTKKSGSSGGGGGGGNDDDDDDDD